MPKTAIYAIYNLRKAARNDRTLSSNYKAVLWKPGPFSVVPPTLTSRFCVWWLFSCCGIMRSGLYRVLLIMENNVVVHRSCLVPKYFRWPFMASADLQISSTWTHPAHRGRGLATYALQYFVNGYAGSGRALWYVTRAENASSIAVCRACYFELATYARRTHRWGSLLLGRFVPISTEISNENLAPHYR